MHATGRQSYKSSRCVAAAFYKLVQGQILQGINPGITRPCVAACQVIKGSITLLHPSPSLPPFLPISRKNFPTMPDFYRLSRKQIILSLKRTILLYSRYIYIYIDQNLTRIFIFKKMSCSSYGSKDLWRGKFVEISRKEYLGRRERRLDGVG